MRGGRRVRGHPVLQLRPPEPSRHAACDGEVREGRDAALCRGEAARRGVAASVAGGLWRNSDDRWSTPEMAMARLCEVSPEHDQSPAAYLRRPAVHPGERPDDRCRREALTAAVYSCDSRPRCFGDHPGSWPQARAHTPRAFYRPRECPRPAVLRAMGDVPSFRAFRGMVAQSGSRKEVDLTDAERLRWCQPRLSLGHHELRGAGDEVLGTLGFQAKSALTWAFTDLRRALAEAR